MKTSSSDEAQIFEQLTTLTQRIAHSADKLLQHEPISPAQLRLLDTLQTLGPCTQATLAGALKSTPANISQLLTKLEALGLVHRTASGVRKRIALSARGTQALKRLRPLRDELIAQHFSALTPQELQIMKMWLERLLC